MVPTRLSDTSRVDAGVPSLALGGPLAPATALDAQVAPVDRADRLIPPEEEVASPHDSSQVVLASRTLVVSGSLWPLPRRLAVHALPSVARHAEAAAIPTTSLARDADRRPVDASLPVGDEDSVMRPPILATTPSPDGVENGAAADAPIRSEVETARPTSPWLTVTLAGPSHDGAMRPGGGTAGACGVS